MPYEVGNQIMQNEFASIFDVTQDPNLAGTQADIPSMEQLTKNL